MHDLLIQSHFNVQAAGGSPDPRLMGLDDNLVHQPSVREATVELYEEHDRLVTVWLRIETEDGQLFREPVAPEADLVMGSAITTDVCVSDPTVSARHCRVVHRGTYIEVIDLGSRNGVRVGGVRIQRASFVPGGCFEIGRTLVQIEGARRLPLMEDGPPLSQLIGQSLPMRQLAASVRKVAPLRLPVLIRGESGTGKDLIARAIHEESTRADKPFIILNAATIMRELAESELFGHKRGAFTGATRDRRGAFQQAHQGTLFLDEIAALSLENQAKLLRVVEEGTVRPLGTEAAIPVDVRLVVATCEPLETLVTERQFRADLYERLAVYRIHVPPLRDRAEDIPLLAEYLLGCSEMGSRELSPGALTALRAHRWQGNVRELRNVLLQAALRAKERITAEHVMAVITDRVPMMRRRPSPAEALQVFEEVGGNISAAARRAELPRTTMRDLIRAALKNPPSADADADAQEDAEDVSSDGVQSLPSASEL